LYTRHTWIFCRIVKGWTEHGQSFEQVYDMVWSRERKPNRWTGKIPPIKSTLQTGRAAHRLPCRQERTSEYGAQGQ